MMVVSNYIPNHSKKREKYQKSFHPFPFKYRGLFRKDIYATNINFWERFPYPSSFCASIFDPKHESLYELKKDPYRPLSFLNTSFEKIFFIFDLPFLQIQIAKLKCHPSFLSQTKFLLIHNFTNFRSHPSPPQQPTWWITKKPQK